MDSTYLSLSEVDLKPGTCVGAFRIEFPRNHLTFAHDPLNLPLDNRWNGTLFSTRFNSKRSQDFEMDALFQLDNIIDTWWRHQMETFSALLAICAGNSPVPGEFPALWPVTRSFDVFFDQRLSKRLSKQWWGWWFETLSCPLWRHCNEFWLGRDL